MYITIFKNAKRKEKETEGPLVKVWAEEQSNLPLALPKYAIDNIFFLIFP